MCSVAGFLECVLSAIMGGMLFGWCCVCNVHYCSWGVLCVRLCVWGSCIGFVEVLRFCAPHDWVLLGGWWECSVGTDLGSASKSVF